jgi:hypothetical protein
LSIAAALTILVGLAPQHDKVESAPRYTKNGDLIRPTGYREWIFCGSDLGIAYGSESATAPRQQAPAKDYDSGIFHNVYIDRAAYTEYAKTKTFPDKTVLVLELFESSQKEPQHIVSRGRYEAKRVGFEVAVKNSARPDGSKTPWAYYSFTNRAAPSAPPLATAKAQSDANCYDCHLKHADHDNVWVQFYPALRDLDGG